MARTSTVQQLAHWAEIVASVAVVVSLLFLVSEVRTNTRVLERQAVLDRTAAFNTAFLEGSALPTILTKIKAVDGFEPVEQALAARYDLDYQEAVRWTRHLAVLWTVLESDFRVNGPSPALEGIAWGLLGSADNQLYWDQGAPQVTSGEFRGYVAGLRAARQQLQ